MKIFVPTKKSGPFLDPFWSKIWPFSLKNQVFGHFLRIRTSKLSKTWSETGDNWFKSSNASVVSEKIIVLAVLFIFGSKIHCLWWHYMVLGCFLSFSFKSLVIFCYFLLFEVILLFKNCQWKFLFRQKIGAIFYPLLVQNLAIFAQKSGFRTFSSNAHIRFV